MVICHEWVDGAFGLYRGSCGTVGMPHYADKQDLLITVGVRLSVSPVEQNYKS